MHSHGEQQSSRRCQDCAGRASPSSRKKRFTMKLFTGTARCYLVAGLTALILGCSSTRPVDDIEGMPKVSTKQTYSYTQDIQPIFEQKCLACHGCYDSPCQLNLASADGLLRGSSKQKIYGLRLRETSPTRMFTDAETTLGWRQKGFYSVLKWRKTSSSGSSAKMLVRCRRNLRNMHARSRCRACRLQSAG